MTMGGGWAPKPPTAPPPVDFSGNPVFVPAPKPVVVDRQLYLQQQQKVIQQQQERQEEQARMAAQQSQYNNFEQRTQFLAEQATFRNRLQPAEVDQYDAQVGALSPGLKEVFGRTRTQPITGEGTSFYRDGERPYAEIRNLGLSGDRTGNQLEHELQHASSYEQTPQWWAEWEQQVRAAAARGNKLAKEVVDAGMIERDPAHAYTIFAQVRPNLVPPELYPFYKRIAPGIDEPPDLREEQARAGKPRGDDDEPTPREAADEVRRRAGLAIAPIQRGVGEASRISQQARQQQIDELTRTVYDDTDINRQMAARRQLQEMGVDIEGRDLAAGARNVAKGAYNVARTDIPYADRVAETVGDVARPVFQAAARINPATAPGQLAGELLPNVPTPSGVAAGILEASIPREVWDTALTLIPAAKARTIGELLAAVSIGDVDAIRAMKAAGAKLADNEIIAAAKTALTAGESGKLEPEKLVPDSVLRTLAKRSPKTAANLPEVQKQWELLPPSYRKLVESMSDIVLLPKERRVILATRRRQIASQLKELQARTDLTPTEKTLEAQKLKAGRIIPQMKAIADNFDATETAEVWDGITKAVNEGLISPYEHDNAVNALHLLFNGERLVQKDLPLSLMPSEIKLLGRIFGPQFEAALPRLAAELSTFQKIIEVSQLPRALQAGFDISAPGRQGILLAARNPVEWLKSWAPMFKSMSSEKGFNDVVESIRLNPKFDEALEHKVDFTFPGSAETAEEAFQSQLIDKLPPGVRHALRGGERGYTAFLNNLRMLTYEKGSNRINRLAERQSWDALRLDKALDDWAWFTNVASGRGDLSAVARLIPALNLGFFSPRYFVSQPQSVWALVRSDPAVRMMVAENLAAFVGTGMTALAALKMSGLAEVEIDPRSTDFGKVRIGNQRINFWGSWQPLVRYSVQLASGERKDDLTKVIEGRSRPAAMSALLRSKFSPTFGIVYDFTFGGGRSYEGEELSFNNKEGMGLYALSQITPLFVQDFYEAYVNQGASAVPTVGLALVGIGVQTYKTRESEKEAAVKTATQAKLTEAGFPDRDQTYADKEPFRNEWAKAFGVDEAEPTFEEFRTNRIAEAVERGMSESEATYKFDNHEFTNLIEQRLKAGRLEFWQQNPKLLKEAIEAGETDWSQEKEKILREAGLLD